MNTRTTLEIDLYLLGTEIAILCPKLSLDIDLTVYKFWLVYKTEDSLFIHDNSHKLRCNIVQSLWGNTDLFQKLTTKNKLVAISLLSR